METYKDRYNRVYKIDLINDKYTLSRKGYKGYKVILYNSDKQVLLDWLSNYGEIV